MDPKHILAEWASAVRALRAAKLLVEEHLFADSVSRAYYGVLHAARAALLAHDTITESHAAVRRLFGDVLVRPGAIEREWGRMLSELQRDRIAADYDVGTGWDSDTSARVLHDAEGFVERIGAYLTDRGYVLEDH